MKYTVEYSSNNSGGRWWLTDSDWEKLEEVGWTVRWYRDEKDRIFGSHKDGRFLRALASRASIEIEAKSASEAMAAGIQKWESDTGQSASEEGCNCCGPPHAFTVKNEDGGEWEYADGEEVLRFLYEDVPGSLRDALEMMGKKRR